MERIQFWPIAVLGKRNMDERILGLAAQIVSAHVGNNSVPSEELPTLIRLLNRLEAEGLVERSALGGQWRAKTVRLTDQGRAVLSELNAITEQTRSSFLEGVDPERLAVCMALFDDLLSKVGGD